MAKSLRLRSQISETMNIHTKFILQFKCEFPTLETIEQKCLVRLNSIETFIIVPYE